MGGAWLDKAASENLENFKKAVDKSNLMWYPNKAVRKTAAD